MSTVAVLHAVTGARTAAHVGQAGATYFRGDTGVGGGAAAQQRGAARAHLPAHDETRVIAALAISTRSICRRTFAAKKEVGAIDGRPKSL
jgi:hypothetical protein